MHGYFTSAAKIEGNFTSEPMIGWLKRHWLAGSSRVVDQWFKLDVCVVTHGRAKQYKSSLPFGSGVRRGRAWGSEDGWPRLGTWCVHWANILAEFLNLAQACVQYLGSLALWYIIIPIISIPKLSLHMILSPQKPGSPRYHSLWSLVVIPRCVRFPNLQLHASTRALRNSKLAHKQLVISTSDQLCPDVDSKPSTRMAEDKTFFYIADFLVAWIGTVLHRSGLSTLVVLPFSSLHSILWRGQYVLCSWGCIALLLP